MSKTLEQGKAYKGFKLCNEQQYTLKTDNMRDILKSLIVPFALSCTIKKLEQKATVTHETARIDEISWPPTSPSIMSSDSFKESGKLDVKLSRYTFPRKVT